MGHLRNYVIRRALILFPMFFGVTLIVFTLIQIAPGDPLTYLLESIQYGGEISQEVIDRYVTRWGLDKPIWQQYLIWLGNVFKGDLGYSFTTGMPVSTLIFARIPNTLKLMGFSLILSLFIAIPVGVISAVRQYSTIDNVTRTVTTGLYAMPHFWKALVYIYIFAVFLGWLPTSGVTTLGGKATLIDQLRHLVLPVLVLGPSGLCVLLIRLTRSSMLEVLKEDYIMTARAKGLKEMIVIYKHALRNALLPIVTVIGLQIGFLLSGAVIVETVFAWPGIGRFFVTMAYKRDYTALMGVQLIVCLMVLLSQLATDISYALLDPRIRYD